MCMYIYIYVYIYVYIFLCVVCPIQMFEAQVWDMHVHMFICFRVPCVHANMYYVCGRVVGMDVARDLSSLSTSGIRCRRKKVVGELRIFFIFYGSWECM